MFIGSITEIPHENFVRRVQCKNRNDIFKPTIGNKSLHKINNIHCVIVVDFAT
jgi:hypothetical protein